MTINLIIGIALIGIFFVIYRVSIDYDEYKKELNEALEREEFERKARKKLSERGFEGEIYQQPAWVVSGEFKMDEKPFKRKKKKEKLYSFKCSYCGAVNTNSNGVCDKCGAPE